MIPLALLLAIQAPGAPEAPRIEDNSLLIEEAYNQEKRVVQHISTFSRARDGSWVYTFTQEWPFLGQTHQLSYTVPLMRDAGRTGLGDVALNYRLQLVGTEGRVAVAPRVSVFLPTGDDRGFGVGTTGLEILIPLSWRTSPHLVTHWNLGVNGARGRSTVLRGGASAIWERGSTFNALVEFTWSQVETDITEMFVNPGIRWAYNFKSGLQIVPAIAVPIGLGPSSGERNVFFYLSFEHPF